MAKPRGTMQGKLPPLAVAARKNGAATPKGGLGLMRQLTDWLIEARRCVPETGSRCEKEKAGNKEVYELGIGSE